MGKRLVSNVAVSRGRRKVAVLALALTTLATPALAGQAGQPAATNGAGSAAIGSGEWLLASRDGRGNWMREYVQMRLAERRLAVLGESAVQDLWQGHLIGPPGNAPMIVGGSVAGPRDNPFQVALLNKSVSNNFNAQFCGGTLVKGNKVVTAAHCSDMVRAGQVQVLTGTRNLDGTGVRHNVTRIDIHPSWSQSNYDYDVAVWTLSSTVRGVPFASLASRDPAVGTSMLVTGWGTLSSGGASPTNLRKVNVPMVSRANCNDRNSYNGQITSRMLCAGYDAGGRDSCQGDSGGPLARGNVLTGIVSWGSGCGVRNKHGVYTRVSERSVRNFIRSKAGL